MAVLLVQVRGDRTSRQRWKAYSARAAPASRSTEKALPR